MKSNTKSTKIIGDEGEEKAMNYLRAQNELLDIFLEFQINEKRTIRN